MPRLSATARYLGENWRPYVSVAYENDVETSVDSDDDDGWVIYGGISSTAMEDRLTMELFLSGIAGRDNQEHNMLGLNLHYAL